VHAFPLVDINSYQFLCILELGHERQTAAVVLCAALSPQIPVLFMCKKMLFGVQLTLNSSLVRLNLPHDTKNKTPQNDQTPLPNLGG
jgi:hypothetical protein